MQCIYKNVSNSLHVGQTSQLLLKFIQGFSDNSNTTNFVVKIGAVLPLVVVWGKVPLLTHQWSSLSTLFLTCTHNNANGNLLGI